MVLAAIIVYVQRTVEQLDSNCSLEEMVNLCPGLTQDHVFRAIEYLVRAGEVCVSLERDGTYWVHPHRAVPVAAP
jgi:hypothetical protein